LPGVPGMFFNADSVSLMSGNHNRCCCRSQRAVGRNREAEGWRGRWGMLWTQGHENFFDLLHIF